MRITNDVVDLNKTIVDDYCKTLEKIKKLKKKADELKHKVIEIDEDVVYGYKYKVIRSYREQQRINTKLLKDEYGQDWYNNHCNLSQSIIYSTARI